MIDPALTPSPLLAATGFMLVDFIKPLLLLPGVIVYARIASTYIEKDVRYHNLGVNKINLIMILGGILAYAAGLLIPIFWVGLPVSLLMLAGFLYWYMSWRNGQVGAADKFELVGNRLEQRREAKESMRAAKAVALRFIDPEGVEKQVPVMDDPLHEVHKELEVILGPGIELNASEIRLVSGKQGATIVNIVDTVASKNEVIPSENAEAAIDYLKRMALMDLEDRRRIQYAKMRMLTPSGHMQMELTVSGSSSGQNARLVFDAAKRLKRPIAELGLMSKQLAELTSLTEVENRHGVVLVASPPGQGQSTSLYSFLGQHDAFTSVVKSVEKKIALEVQGVDQKQWDANVDEADYPTTVRTVLRRDPDVVMVDDIGDEGTAELIAKSGIDGPLMYVGVRARSVTETLQQWSRSVHDLETAVKSLKVIVVSRILRRLCPVCRVPYQPTPEQLKQMGMSNVSDGTFYRPSGMITLKNGKTEPCETCHGSGYTGTVAVYEVFPVDDTARKLLAANDMKGASNHIRRERRLPTLQEAALAKVRKGETSIEEVLRVLVEKKKPTKKPAAQAPAEATN
ncbi:MAG: ATPase, T2SS/T4P/T4SS family [Planctomycetota bacterium]|nr:ATPase, T2SS/T4P/T4SS family [Planctomycetota bacterium]